WPASSSIRPSTSAGSSSSSSACSPACQRTFSRGLTALSRSAQLSTSSWTCALKTLERMVELGRDSLVRIAGSVYARPFGDELVLLDFGRGEYFALDEVGAEVWRGIEHGKPLGTIAAALASDFDVAEEKVLADIFALVRDMRERSLVEMT